MPCAAAPARSSRPAEKHERHCYVVLAEGADADAVRQTIVTMPHYFDEYDTTVNFISAEVFARDHSAMPHGGFVIRSGSTKRRHQACGGVPPAARQQPAIHVQRAGRLRPGRTPHGGFGPARGQNGVRRRPGLDFP